MLRGYLDAVKANLDLMDYKGQIAIYLCGSYFTGNPTPLSDIDIGLFHDQAISDSQVEDILKNILLHSIAPARIDLQVFELRDTIFIPIQYQCSKLIYGVDLIHDKNFESLDEYIKRMAATATFCISKLHAAQNGLTYPLDFPESNHPFYGYTKSGAKLKDGTYIDGTRLMTGTAFYIASTLLAIEKGIASESKKTTLDNSIKSLGEWGVFLERLFDLSVRKLGYTLPVIGTDIILLRRLCRKMLKLENYFLNVVVTHKIESIVTNPA